MIIGFLAHAHASLGHTGVLPESRGSPTKILYGTFTANLSSRFSRCPRIVYKVSHALLLLSFIPGHLNKSYEVRGEGPIEAHIFS